MVTLAFFMLLKLTTHSRFMHWTHSDMLVNIYHGKYTYYFAIGIFNSWIIFLNKDALYKLHCLHK